MGGGIYKAVSSIGTETIRTLASTLVDEVEFGEQRHNMISLRFEKNA